MPFKLIFQLSLRNLWKQKRRNLFMLSAIIIAVAGVFWMNTLARGMGGDILSTALDNLTGHIKVLAFGYRDNPSIEHSFESLDEEMSHTDFIDLQGWARRVVVPSVVMSERNTRGIQLVGVNPSDEIISFYRDLEFEGESLADETDGGIVIGRGLAEELETKLGRKIVVITQSSDGAAVELGFRIKGIYRSGTTSLEELYAFTGIDYLMGVLDSNGVTEISLRLTNNDSVDVNQSSVERIYPHLEVLNWSQMDPFGYEMYSFMSFGLLIMLIVILSTLIFGLVNTIVTAVLQRIREFGLLRAVGMRPSAIVMQVIIESVLLMMVAVILGLGLGYLMYLPLADGLDLSQFTEAMEFMGMKALLIPEIHGSDVATIVGFSLFLGFAASLIPARRAVKVTILETLR